MPPIQTTLNTIKAKINQAEQSDSAVPNTNVPATSYPMTSSTITSTPPTKTANAQPLSPREDKPISDTTTTNEMLQLPEPVTESSTVGRNLTNEDIPDEISNKEDEEVATIRQESVIETVTLEDPAKETIDIAIARANIIRFDDIDDDTDPETATTPDDATQAVAKTPITTSNTITFDDPDGDDELGDDFFPDIDMAGPDTDDEEEGGL